MDIQFFLGLVHNIAVMLLFAWGYDRLWVRFQLHTSVLARVLAGLIMGGIESTIEIRKLDMKLGKHTPIIALTANSITEEREKCLNVGMDEFLSKPIATHKLAEFLNYFLS